MLTYLLILILPTLNCSMSLTTVEYFVPLAIITFAYTRIAFRLWGNKTPGDAHDGRDQNIQDNKKKVI